MRNGARVRSSGSCPEEIRVQIPFSATNNGYVVQVVEHISHKDKGEGANPSITTNFYGWSVFEIKR